MPEKNINFLAIGIMQTTLGLGLLVVPWLLEFHTNSEPSIQFWAVGGAVAVFGILTATRLVPPIAVLTLAAGVWAIAAPFVLGFADLDPVVGVYLLVGAGVLFVIMAIALLLPVRERVPSAV